jgi:hypothetical protein
MGLEQEMVTMADENMEILIKKFEKVSEKFEFYS